MISEIAIKNLAIIDDIRIRFQKGLNVLTGETGAGKSIIINAINLILGSRANSRLIRTGEQTAEIEAEFILEKDSNTWNSMLKNDIDPKNGLIIRRIIARNNRHKIYINQRLSTVQTLNEITENLASVSGQHEHQSLLDERNNLLFLDSFAVLSKETEKVKTLFEDIVRLQSDLNSLKAKKRKIEKDLELINFQKNEIESAELKSSNEDQVIENELRVMRNSKRLIEISKTASLALYSENNSVTDIIATIKKDLEQAVSIDKNFAPFLEQLESAYAEITDLSNTMINYSQEIETDEEKIIEMEERLEIINRLKHKYGSSIEEVKAFYNEISSRSDNFESLDKEIKNINEKIGHQRDDFLRLAQKLSSKRKSAAQKLMKVITKSIRELEMPHADFIAILDSGEEYLCETGIDKLDFLISPNPGEDPKPISETASGGELSRLILAIKSATAETENVSTIIFDEADAGIGGQTAEKTGEKIKKISSKSQIICITHLPQIAKFSDHHYFISKNVENNRTKTSIKTLSRDEKIQEIARMISGEKITTKTLEHAREMIDQSS